MSGSHTLGELAQLVVGDVRGDREREIRGLATLEEAGPAELSFFTNPRYRKAALATRAGAVLVGAESGLVGHDLLEVREPYMALAVLLETFHPRRVPSPGVSARAEVDPEALLGRDVRIEPFAVLEPGSVLGERVIVGAGCFVGAGCEVGADSELGPRVVLYPGTRVGARCLIHAGAVLGGDGFGFATSGGRHRKLRQVGRVVIEDDVEIGANTAIDRAMLGETRIGRGSKIDDLVMVAHGVHLGADSVLAAQAGIAGSSRLGSRLTLAGQTGVAGHLRIGDGVTVAAKSAVFEDLGDGAFVAGVPAIALSTWRRAQALFKHLPEIRSELRTLRERLEALESQGPGEK